MDYLGMVGIIIIWRTPQKCGKMFFPQLPAGITNGAASVAIDTISTTLNRCWQI